MYFFKSKGKQVLDLHGDLVLTHNKALVIGRSKSAAPSEVKNGRYVLLPNLTAWGKFKACLIAWRFIWSRSIEPIDERL